MDEQRSAITQVVLDYFEGWFDGDEERMDRALHPDLAKRSFEQGKDAPPGLSTTTKQRMVSLTAQGSGKQEGVGADRRIDVDVVDLYGNIGAVVVRSAPYREYLHLVRTGDGWKIVNALWHLT